MRILQFSDTHIGPDPGSDYLGVPTRAALGDLLALARAHDWPPRAILLTGDLSYDGETQAYQWLRETFGALQVPVYALPGNHDDPDRLRAMLHGPTLAVADAVLLDAWQILLLDTTAPPAHGGRLPPPRLAALREQLAARPALHTLIAMHHHPLPMGSAWLDALGLSDAAAFWEIAAQAGNLRAVCFGHVHQAFDAWQGTVRVLGCPSTCMQFTPGCERFTLDTRAPGYRWFDLHGDGSFDTGVRRLAELPLRDAVA